MNETDIFSQHTLMMAYKAFLYEDICLPGLNHENSLKIFYEYAQNKFLFTPSQIKSNIVEMKKLEEMKERSHLTIYLDGSVQSACKGKDEEISAGGGFLVQSKDSFIYETSYSLPTSYDGVKTNSHIAEYESLSRCLDYLESSSDFDCSITTLDVWTDSKNLVRQMNGDARIRNTIIRGLRKKIKKQLVVYRDVTIKHLPREQNERANLLARTGRKNQEMTEGGS